jgi:hypothetical protein
VRAPPHAVGGAAPGEGSRSAPFQRPIANLGGIRIRTAAPARVLDAPGRGTARSQEDPMAHPHALGRRRGAARLTAALAVALVAAACGGDTTAPPAPAAPECVKADGGGCLPLAPKDKRVDLATPVFTHPTSVTNPLHPSSALDQVVYGGQVDEAPFRTEFTRLRDTKKIIWNRGQVDTVVMQYLAFSGGRIHEVALDWFAQADDGSVWYFGEDVYNYDDGVLADTEGSWQAGRDGPPAMIMPAKPAAGAAYRSENIPGLVFEEVTVRSTGQSVTGPAGPVGGAIVADELHMDGTREDKTFAPGYGEFSTGSPSGDLEQVAFAVPTDVRPGAAPTRLAALSGAVRKAFDSVGRGDWAAASAASAELGRAWDAYRSTGVPDLLGKQMTRDVETLGDAVGDRDGEQARAAALRVAQNDLDLRLRNRPVAEVDLARVDLWARQLLVDAAADEPGAVSGDVITLGWTWDRVRHTVEAAAAASIDARIRGLRKAAEHSDVAVVAKDAPALQAAVAGVRPR